MFSGFYWVLLSLEEFYWIYWVFSRFYWVFLCVLLGLHGVAEFLLVANGFYWVLTGFYWFLVVFTGFY